MRDIESLAEAYLAAERDLVAAVDAAGGTVLVPDGRTVTTGRAVRRRAWQAAQAGMGDPNLDIRAIDLRRWPNN